MSIADPGPGNPAFSSSGQSIPRPRSNRPYLLRQGVLSPASNLNLDAWKQYAGIFPRRLDIVLRYCAARDRDLQNLDRAD
ncbi:hypothetical protein [Microcoleus sp. BROC3]|uniref:hypothetical protein n=1 Tax=Microcoleus sp. BROC3 TaxID=3055323 RepID=UPI002FCF2009